MKYILITIAFFISFSISAQEYHISTVGFYNLENLFDTVNQENVRDSEFTPDGEKKWDSEKYQKKLDNMARVISEIGVEKDPDGIDILGVSEVENVNVLLDLTAQERIKNKRFQVLHGDSKDERGIDVALLFDPKVFLPDSFSLLEVVLYDDRDGSRDYTRDILYTSGKISGEPIHIFVNHWPSRSGGEVASAPGRKKCADILRKKLNKILEKDENAKVIIMGDFNDDPISSSMVDHLQAEGRKKNINTGDLYNTHANYYHRGIGSNAYRDAWNLFDQVIISSGLLNAESGYRFYSSSLFRKSYLFQKTGNFKGYPFRTFAGDRFMNGYSDHFPAYIYLIKDTGKKQ